MSSILDYEDRNTCIIFGDGAGAVLLEPDDTGAGLVASAEHVDGSGVACLYIKAGGSLHPASHATYYPGASTMALKLLVDPATGEILGAQGVGREGIDKRIDVIATAMTAGMTAPELAELELAYAPHKRA